MPGLAVEGTGREGALTTAFANALVERGWQVTRIPVTEGRVDVLATAGAGPYVTLSTHLDTVPPYIAPYMMPESMTMALTGSMPKDTGSSSAMPSDGPMPGSAPITWPRNTPISTASISRPGAPPIRSASARQMKELKRTATRAPAASSPTRPTNRPAR